MIMEINDVLVPIDFSACSLRALDNALTMVPAGGEIYLLNVIDTKLVDRIVDYGIADRDAAITRMRTRAEDVLDSIIAQQEPTGMKLNKMVVVGVPFVEILKIAKDLDFNLIVMGIRGGENRIEDLLFGSTADKVLRGTRIPVLCVP
jgi:glycine betaine transporter